MKYKIKMKFEVERPEDVKEFDFFSWIRAELLGHPLSHNNDMEFKKIHDHIKNFKIKIRS